MNNTLRFFHRVILAFSLLATICGCVKEDEAPIGQKDLHDVVFHAGWAPETKTVLQEDGSVWWSPGDEISLFVGSGDNGGYKLTSTNSEPTATVDFIGQIGDNPNNAYYIAIYPYNENAYCREDGLMVSTLPDVQYVKPGTFADGQLISAAKSKDKNLYFYNICGGIKFSVANEGISKVVFTSGKSLNTTQDYPIAGNVYAFLGLNNNRFESGLSGEDNSLTITALPLEGEYFIPGQYYYVAIAPTTIPQLEVTYYKRDSLATYIFNNNLECGGNWPVIKRATIKTLAEKDRNLAFLGKDKKYSIISVYDFWPIGWDERRTITAVNFHTKCSELKGTVIRSSEGHSGYYPVSVERNGTVIDFYTEADELIPDDCNGLFADFSSLTELDLSMFNTDNIPNFHTMFRGCTNLKRLDISSFSSKGVVVDQDPFQVMFDGCYNMLSLDLGDLEITGSALLSMRRFATISHNCAIRCSSETREVLMSSYSPGFNDQYITWVLPDEEMPDLEPYEFDYYSTDYSKDKTVRVLQQASMGNGINIILMGDGYSDRMISDGSYDSDMIKAMNAIFKDEPYASFREYFNVYAVYAVSENEIPGASKTVFYTYFADPGEETCNYDIVKQYAKIPDDDINETCIILIVNQEPSWHAGIATYLYPAADDQITDYAKGGLLSWPVVNRRMITFPLRLPMSLGTVLQNSMTSIVLTAGAWRIGRKIILWNILPIMAGIAI